MYKLIKSTMFCGNQCDFYSNESDEIFMTSSQLGSCLEYAEPRKSISKIVERNKYLKNSEFSTVVNLTTPSGTQETRLFTEDGIYEVTMLSKTEKSKDFRAFVRGIVKSIRKGESTVISSKILEEVITKTATAVVIEIVKQLTCFSVTSIQQEKNPAKRIAKPYKYSTPSKISTLPPEVKEQVDEMIISGNYSCQKIANFIINSTGIYISQMAVNRYKRNNFESNRPEISLEEISRNIIVPYKSR